MRRGSLRCLSTALLPPLHTFCRSCMSVWVKVPGPPKLIHHPTYRAQNLSRRCEEVHPVLRQHNGHDRAREGRIFGTDPRVNIWPFGLSTARGPSRAAPLGHRAPRTPLVRLGLAQGCPWHGRSVLLLRVGLLPGAETAAAGQAGSRPLGPAQGVCSPPPMPAHAAHAAPHARRPTQAHAPRPAHARRSRRRSQP